MSELVFLREDPELVWVDKPAGLLSVRGLGPENQDCVVARVADRFDWVREVHRLDQATSGILVLALNPQAHRELCRQFRERETEKEYEAVVDGSVGADSGIIDLPIRLDVDNRPRQIVDHEQGKQAETHFEVLDRDQETTRLRLVPVTGRSHQLRLHLASIGHPILGDDLYADEQVRMLADRLLLHATRLTVHHPSTGECITVESACPF